MAKSECPTAFPTDVYNLNGSGFSPCFIDFYIASLLPAAVLFLVGSLALWCNRRNRVAYSLLITSRNDSPPTPFIRFGSPLIALTCTTTILHWTSLLDIIGDRDLDLGSLLAAAIRGTTWSLATLISTYTVMRPFKYPFRGYIAYSSVLTTFYGVSACASLTTILALHASEHVSMNFVFLAAVISNCALMILCSALRISGDRCFDHSLPTSMDSTLPPSKEINASLVSLAFFSWFSEIISLGSRKSLEVDDLWNLYPNDQAATSNKMFLKTHPEGNSLIYALWLCLRHHLTLQIITGVLGAMLSFSGPLFLNLIITFVQSGNSNSAVGLTYVVLLLLSTSLRSIIDNQTYFRGRRIGIRVRSIIIGQIYAKALRVGDKQSSNGQVMNMIQIDASKILEFTCYLHYFITTPLQIIMAVVALYHLLGWASLAGVGVMLCVVPLNALTGKNATRLQLDLMNSTDKRTQVTTEIFSGIRTLKTFGWEARTFKWIQRIRLDELRHLRRYLNFTIALSLLWYFVPLAVTMGTFFCYAFIMAQPLTATKVFTAISLFMALKMPLFILPDMLIRFLEVRVSFRRIRDYLAKPEIHRISESGHVQMNHACFTFPNTPGEKPVLSDLTMSIPEGKLTLICGRSGCGKSSLIHSLLGELSIHEGTIQVPRGFAYVSQQAWLQNATIRDNVLFGSKYNARRYAKVISSCGLEKDFALLGGGDMTEIGDKGAGLSGGQKSRLNLARAAYSPFDTVIMDDIFSALDTSTAKHVFDNCVLKLMHDRTRILVTHAVGLGMARADYVIVLDGGRIVSQGPPSEVAKLRVMDELLFQDREHDEIAKTATEVVPVEPKFITSGCIFRNPSLGPPDTEPSPASVDRDECRNLMTPKLDLLQGHSRHVSFESNVSLGESKTSHMSTISSMADLHIANVDLPCQEHTTTAAQMTLAEERCRGSVDWHVYKTWISATGGIRFWAVLIALVISQQSLAVSQDMWLRHWTNAYSDGHVDVVYYLVTYIAIGISTVAVIGVRLFTQFRGSMRASTILHDKLVDNLLYVKIRFYDTTPLGRIINRISRDIQTVDRDVARDIVDCMYNASQLISVVIIITYAVPLFLLFLIPLAFLYWSICKYFLNCSRELKRLDSLTRSPIYALFSETLAGVSIIRAYNDEERFVREAYRRIDHNHRSFFYLWVSNRWLSVRSDHIGALAVFSTGLVLITTRSWMDPALAGVLLSYSLNVSDCLMWLIRVQAMVEMDMNSIERIEEWNKQSDREPGNGLTASQLPDGWPFQGAIQVKDLTVQYSAAVPVLHNISFSVSPGTRLGAVGRTGAGKSTLAAALFRFVEFTHGSIFIDGIDICKVALATLRTGITMVPQDSVLFSGTLRSNLDVFSLYTDDQLLDVLERIQLGHLRLDEQVAEGGSNYSVGMRQMLSLGRALLRRPKVLVLDEATGSVDAKTDALITETIRNEFNCTIITIAHRLQTVIDYDQILVLDAGCVKEFGKPRDLMLRCDGMFHKMCQESGQFDVLLAATKD